MKTIFPMILIMLFMILAWTPDVFTQDYTQWGLPEGAKARLGKGDISEIQYSPDGRRLAVASSIGIWIYNAQTGQELDLSRGIRVGSIALHSVLMGNPGKWEW